MRCENGNLSTRFARVLSQWVPPSCSRSVCRHARPHLRIVFVPTTYPRPPIGLGTHNRGPTLQPFFARRDSDVICAVVVGERARNLCTPLKAKVCTLTSIPAAYPEPETSSRLLTSDLLGASLLHGVRLRKRERERDRQRECVCQVLIIFIKERLGGARRVSWLVSLRLYGTTHLPAPHLPRHNTSVPVLL